MEISNLNKILLKGAENWNEWRMANQVKNPDLTGAYLKEASLSKANLIGVNLTNAILHKADLCRAKLQGANLKGADLHEANLNKADLTGANLSEADLSRAILVETDLSGATMTGCNVYGISAWDITLTGTVQKDLKISANKKDPDITVDNIEVAQFIYFLIDNDNIRKFIDTVGKKGVLIIGRFTDQRKKILHLIRDELRSKYDLQPIMFEFDPLSTEPTIKTLSTLAHLCRFVIADLTDAKSVLQELTTILNNVSTLPVQPILQKGADLPPMGDSFLIRESVLELYTYDDGKTLIKEIPKKMISPAENRAKMVEEKLKEIRKAHFPWQNKDDSSISTATG